MAQMRDRIAHFVSLGASFGYVFAFRIEECRDIELFFDDYLGGGSVNADEALTFFSRYIGELFLRNYGGAWTLYQGSQNDVDHNTPVIAGWLGTKGIPFVPRRAIAAYHVRHQKGMIRQILDAHVAAVQGAGVSP